VSDQRREGVFEWLMGTAMTWDQVRAKFDMGPRTARRKELGADLAAAAQTSDNKSRSKDLTACSARVSLPCQKQGEIL